MRVSHHRQRDRQVDLRLIQLRIWAVWSSVQAVSTTSTRPPSLTIKPLEATAPETRHVEIGSVLPDIRCELAENQIAKPLVASFHLLANRRADFTGHAPAQHQCSG
nr:hypothetical protein [Escherichia coli]